MVKRRVKFARLCIVRCLFKRALIISLFSWRKVARNHEMKSQPRAKAKGEREQGLRNLLFIKSVCLWDSAFIFIFIQTVFFLFRSFYKWDDNESAVTKYSYCAFIVIPDKSKNMPMPKIPKSQLRFSFSVLYHNKDWSIQICSTYDAIYNPQATALFFA